jgi:hypothetical protein
VHTFLTRTHQRKNASGAEAARGGSGRNMDDPSSLRGLISRLQEAVSVRDEKLAEAEAELAKAAAAAKAAQEAAKVGASYDRWMIGRQGVDRVCCRHSYVLRCCMHQRFAHHSVGSQRFF